MEEDFDIVLKSKSKILTINFLFIAWLLVPYLMLGLVHNIIGNISGLPQKRNSD